MYVRTKLPIAKPNFSKLLLSIVEHYRPVSILPTISKLLEFILSSKLFSLVQNLIVAEQRGYCQKWLTLANLREGFAAKFVMRAVYRGFHKVFAKVHHSALLHKSVAYGLGVASWSCFRIIRLVEVSMLKCKNVSEQYRLCPLEYPRGPSWGRCFFSFLLMIFWRLYVVNFVCLPMSLKFIGWSRAP